MTPRVKPKDELERVIRFSFKNKDFLEEALTHRSYLNENPSWKVPHNERLEFLGDAVLELVVTDALFHAYPKRQEGELTSLRAALVNHIMLGRAAAAISLEQFIHLSKGEAKESSRAKDAILANAMEALIGAIYLDQGYLNAAKFIETHILAHLDEVVEKQLFIDAKSELQEIVQERLKLTPTYQIIEEHGPDHEKKFTAGVLFGSKLIAKGSGFSKQEAERAAAAAALAEYQTRQPSP